MLGIGKLNVNGALRIRISQVMQITRIGSLAEGLAATKRTRSIPKIAAALADLRLGKILDMCYTCAFGKREKKQNFLGGLASLGAGDIRLLEHLTVVPRHPAVGM